MSETEETKIELTADAKEICTRLGTAFSVISAGFMPAVVEAIERVEPGKEISFGCTVKMKKEAGVIVSRLLSNEPKIPTPAHEPIHFLLERDDKGQLSFLFPGTLKEMRAELAERDIKPDPDDDYTPGDNANP